MSETENSYIEEAGGDPMTLCRNWIIEAADVGETLPQAVTLATVDEAGHPTVRMMTIRELDAKGFEFFTHAGSRKARHLSRTPHAALSFHWPLLNRQVSATGTVISLERQICEAAFRKRPEGARIATSAWQQSQPVSSRAELEQLYNETRTRFNTSEIPTPADWVGYVLVPMRVEFWAGHDHGVDERLEVTRATVDSPWQSQILAP